jgi:flavin reductase (DIM6/NTAB) family NADH-FMN oxidoreductase RutF
MAVFNVQDLSVAERQKLITGGIGPRPIALVSTLSDKGVANVSPFSFFNAFGANPPIVAFSPARRGRDGSLKDTYFNCKSTGECTISMVSFAMVEQVSLASTEYEEAVDEFVKSGLEKAASTFVKPSGVADSPFWMECKVLDIIHTGEGNGAGNIVLCEILAFHVADAVIDEHLQINPNLSDVVGRYGGADYVRASGSAIFSIPKPTAKGLGFDALPAFLLNSNILSANNLARLANQTVRPDKSSAKQFIESVSTLEFNRAEFERAERIGDADLLLAMAKSSQSVLHFEKAIKAYLNAWQEDNAWAIVVFIHEIE